MKAWEENIRRVEPYVPGEQPKKAKMIKLNTNENPYAPAPGVTAAAHGFDTDCLRLYPDPTAATLVEALAERYGLSPDQVFVGVGSDDVLAMAFLTFFNSKKKLRFVSIINNLGRPYRNISVIKHKRAGVYFFKRAFFCYFCSFNHFF